MLTPRIGDSHVRIGVDIIGEPSEVPVIFFGNEMQCQKEMERISEGFSTSNTLLEFEIVATGQKNPASSSTEVIASGLTQSWRIARVKLLRAQKNFRKAKRVKKTFAFEGSVSPKGGWHVSPDGSTVASNHLGTTASAFHFKKYLPVHVPPYPKATYKPDRENNFTFYLSHSPRGGIAIVKTPAEEKTIDLYSETEGKSRIDVSTVVSKNFRYYASVPRRNFTNTGIFFGANGQPDVFRLYIASFIPKSFFKTERQPAHAMGSITENWRPHLENGLIALPPIPAWEQGGCWTFVAVFLLSSFVQLLAVLTIWLMVCVLRNLLTSSCRHYAVAPFSRKTFFNFLWPIMAVLLIWLICFYPGLMSPDSVSQWKQAHGDKTLHDATPVFHTMIWKGLFIVWDSPAIIITVHILAMSGLLAYAYSLLWRLGVPKAAVIIACLASMLSIRNGFMAVLLWKGTLHATVILGITILLVHFLTGRHHKSIFYWAVLGIALALCPLLRHNGLSVFAGMILLLPLFFWHLRKRAITAVIIALLSYGAVQLLLFPALGVKRYTQTHMPANRVARYLAQDTPLRKQEYHLIDEYTLLFKEPWAYNNILSGANGIYKWRKWPMATSDIKYREVMGIFEPTRFPGIRILSYFHRHKYILWPPFSKYDGNIETQSNSHYLTIKMAKEYGFRCPCGLWDSGQQYLMKWLRKTLKPNLVWLCWRGGVHFWLILVALGICLWRHGDYRLMVIYMPVLLHAAGLLAVDARQCARLLFPMTFAAGFLTCLAFVPLQDRILGLASLPKYK